MAADRFPDTSHPAAVDGVETAIFDGEAVLFRESSSTIHRLGAVAGAVWVCCDGGTTVAEMVTDLAEAFSATTDEMSRQVHDALGQLADEGLLVGHDGPQRIRLDPVSEPASDGSTVIACPPDY